jgi:hypothetical protein
MNHGNERCSKEKNEDCRLNNFTYENNINYNICKNIYIKHHQNLYNKENKYKEFFELNCDRQDQVNENFQQQNNFFNTNLNTDCCINQTHDSNLSEENDCLLILKNEIKVNYVNHTTGINEVEAEFENNSNRFTKTNRLRLIQSI